MPAIVIQRPVGCPYKWLHHWDGSRFPRIAAEGQNPWAGLSAVFRAGILEDGLGLSALGLLSRCRRPVECGDGRTCKGSENRLDPPIRLHSPCLPRKLQAFRTGFGGYGRANIRTYRYALRFTLWHLLSAIYKNR